MNKKTAYRLDTGLAIIFLLTLTLHCLRWMGNFDTTIVVVVALIGIVPVLFGAVQSLRNREWASMELLASIALVFSLLACEWVSAVFIELMLAAARILDNLTQDRTEQSIKGLLKLRPSVARVERHGKVEQIAVSDIAVGDIVLVSVEERIPVDGTVLSGTAAVDESSLTGESLPIDKQVSDTVLSSTLLKSGSLRIVTTKIGSETTIEKIIALVESAREEKPTTQTLGERFGKLYLLAILLGSVGLYFVTQNLSLVLAVVLVVCADDIAIAIPIAYLRAIKAAASAGIIVKGSKYLETLGQIDTLVFDKTGTLTTGNVKVTTVTPSSGHNASTVLEVAMTVAQQSSHPISRAIVSYAQTQQVSASTVDSVEECGGKGVVAIRDGSEMVVGRRSFIDERGDTYPAELLTASEAEASKGQSISFVAQNGEVIGFIAAADSIKENAQATLAELHTLGVRNIVLLSGDNEAAVKTVASQLGIDTWHANLLPEDKIILLKKIQENNHVAMVGDGVNDAAALSVASVGIAMGGLGTEGAIESAQIVLMRDDLSGLPIAIRIARTARSVSIQDFLIWGVTNVIGLVLVFGGVIGPSGAAAYNFISDFFPLANSLRIRK